MAKKLTKLEWVEKAKSIHGGTYDYSESVYTNSRTKISITCKIHGKFNQRGMDHLKGSGCPECSLRTSFSTITTRMLKFIEKAKELHSNKYSYDKVVYKNSKEKVIITCPKHGDFEQIPNSHLQGNGCSKCGGTCKLSNIDFINNSKKVHKNTYFYDKTNYSNSKTKVIITCSKHGDFKQNPHDHLLGAGCPECGYEAISKHKTKLKENYVREVKEVHNYYYDYSLVEYTSANDRIAVICPKHGKFIQNANSHLRGRGCPSCSKSGFDPNKPGLLYYLKVVTTGEKAFYKIGITNKTVNERFSVKDLQKIEVLNTIEYNLGKEAYDKEQEILKEFKEFKYTGPDILESGNTELFTKDVLNKDTLCMSV